MNDGVIPSVQQKAIESQPQYENADIVQKTIIEQKQVNTEVNPPQPSLAADFSSNQSTSNLQQSNVNIAQNVPNVSETGSSISTVV